jgi:hypothetical protein
LDLLLLSLLLLLFQLRLWCRIFINKSVYVTNKLFACISSGVRYSVHKMQHCILSWVSTVQPTAARAQIIVKISLPFEALSVCE